jgi:electron transport complex protein RnfE
MSRIHIITKGIIKENPIFVLLLGMCPTLGTTSSAINGMGMGLATMAVLTLSNIVISLISGLVPDKVRIPAYVVVIATFTGIVQLLMEAYTPALYEALGVFIPLIAVNCIVLGRAEAYASKNSVINAACDGMGMGLGFVLALTILGTVREVLGNMSVFGYKFAQGDGMLAFILAPGAFIALGYLIVIFKKLTAKRV